MTIFVAWQGMYEAHCALAGKFQIEAQGRDHFTLSPINISAIRPHHPLAW